jgi:hypothetical protein
LRPRLKLGALIPLLTQVLPLWIDRNDQCNLLNPQQTFNLLLALNRVTDILEALKVNQAVELVLRCETGANSPSCAPAFGASGC